MSLIGRWKSYRIRFAKERPSSWYERRYRLGDKVWDSLYRCPVAESTVRRMERTFARLHRISPPCYRPHRMDHWLFSLLSTPISLFPSAPSWRGSGNARYMGVRSRANA